MWEIIDENETIHSGSEEDMNYAFDVMCEPDAYGKPIREQYTTKWSGDLKLIQIHKTHR